MTNIGLTDAPISNAKEESLGMEARFEKAFKMSLNIWGRVYEPFVVMMSAPDLLKGGYVKYLPKWMEYAGFHFPHKVKRISTSKTLEDGSSSKEGRS